jgi:hypothetical protein
MMGHLSHHSVTILMAGALTLLQPARADAQANAVGQWTGPFKLPQVAVHAHVLPSGKLLTYNDNYKSSGALSQAYVINIPLGGEPLNTTSYFNNEVNLFCAGHTFLPNGDLLVVGGQTGDYYYGIADATVFSEAAGGWSRPANGLMATGRWYPTVTALASGDVLALGGNIVPGTHNRIPEVWQTATSRWRQLTGASLQVKIYSWAFQAPDGRVFVAGPAQQTRYLDTTGSGRWTAAGKSNFGERMRGTAVVYDDGKILIAGGANPATKTAEIIDLKAASPTWKYTGAMAFARRMHNLTVLPDGTVLVTGGGSSGNTVSSAVLPAELWDPETGQWTKMASMTQPRLYHSTAVLLPDGRVLAAGTGRPAPKGGTNLLNAEIFSPPYLFMGSRPTISSAPASVGFGETFFVGTPDGPSITKATLIKLSSTTHGLNMGQRLTRVTSISAADGGLNLKAPTDRNLATPGHYLLFLLNGEGVPSMGKVIRIG